MSISIDLPDIDPSSESVRKRIARTFAGNIEKSSQETNPVPHWKQFAGEMWGLSDFSPHQTKMWDWASRIELGVPMSSHVGIWPRDHGKSTTAEAITCYLGAKRATEYAVYVSGTQDQADKHVASIESFLTSNRLSTKYPELSTPQVNRVGQIKGWRRDRLTTASGLVIDALGLDVKARGIKFGMKRPDLIILDDIDEEHDSAAITDKKEQKITNKILGIGSDDTKVLAIQNVIKEDGIFHRIGNGEADYLLGADVVGPIKAVENIEYKQIKAENGYKYRVTGGTPTWSQMGLKVCERLINRIGISAFLRECQHEVDDVGGGIFDHIEYRHATIEDVWEKTDIVRVVVAVDPAVTSNDKSDSYAIQVDALGEDGIIYRLFSWEQQSSPEKTIRLALRKSIEMGADRLVIETDQGGDTWESVVKRAWSFLVGSEDYPQITKKTRRTRIQKERTGSTQKSKTARGMEMLHDYERGRIVHVTGTHLVLEKALNRAFVTKPFDLADASYWSWNDLRNKSGGRAHSLN